MVGISRELLNKELLPLLRAERLSELPKGQSLVSGKGGT